MNIVSVYFSILLFAIPPSPSKGIHVDIEKIEYAKDMAEKVLKEVLKLHNITDSVLIEAQCYKEKADSLLDIYSKRYKISPEMDENKEGLVRAWRYYAIVTYLAVKPILSEKQK